MSEVKFTIAEMVEHLYAVNLETGGYPAFVEHLEDVPDLRLALLTSIDIALGVLRMLLGNGEATDALIQQAIRAYCRAAVTHCLEELYDGSPDTP